MAASGGASSECEGVGAARHPMDGRTRDTVGSRPPENPKRVRTRLPDWGGGSPAPRDPPNGAAIEPPWYGPVCPVVWEGRSREAPPYPHECKFACTNSRLYKTQAISRAGGVR